MSDAPTPPADVRELVAERAAARTRRDWAEADALRGRIRAAGWEVEDGPGGSSVRPVLATEELQAERLADPAQVALSIQARADDHPEDLERLLRGLAAWPPAVAWELVIVADAPSFDVAELLGALDLAADPILVHRHERLGWADARTLGLRRSRGEITLLLDASVEPTGDVAAPLLAAFADASVGLAGAWGLTSEDGRQFEEASSGEVDAVEAYCLAVRRAALQAVGGFDPRFRFYRNADIDFSFAVRDAGWRAVVAELPLIRHEHRGWTELPPDERDRLSRRNFYRYLDRWGRRPDLLIRSRRDGG